MNKIAIDLDEVLVFFTAQMITVASFPKETRHISTKFDCLNRNRRHDQGFLIKV